MAHSFPLETVSQLVIPRRNGREIQNNLIFSPFSGFPFDFAQGGEFVEPRVSPPLSLPRARYGVRLTRNDSFVELRHSLLGGGNEQGKR